MDLGVNLVEEAQEQGINRFVVGAIVSRDAKILLLQRPEDDFMGGIYELPSGKVEQGEMFSTALIREVAEETGLDVKKIVKYLGHFDYESKSSKKTRQFNYIVTVQEPLEVKLQEHSAYTWARPDELDKYPVTESVKHVVNSSME